ncbi:MAG: hypothetical protein R3350_02345 [Saprospiraceae bacterium]|nr:hypothetical protein [Saprospiraceae bacterium]
MRKIIAIAVVVTFCLGSGFSQGLPDAVRYSFFNYTGSARSVGAGGTLGALGADFAVMSTNPAGLAMYRKSDIIFTPGFLIREVDSRLTTDPNSPVVSRDQNTLALDNLGIVFASVKPETSRWRTFNIAIGLNQLANFKREFIFSGNSTGSIVDRFQELANLQGFSSQEAALAINADAVYDLEEDGIYESDVELAPNARINKEQLVTETGTLSELVLSFAGNYEERLLFGATIGLPIVNFEQEKIYQEEDENGTVPFFDNLRYDQNLTTTGVGINFKLGMIYRAHQMLRLGFAVHSPTGYSLEDSFSSRLVYNFTDDGQAFTGQAQAPGGSFSYDLNSPWRFMGSVGVLFGKIGFLSADVEYVDYGGARLIFDGFEEDEEIVNADINQNLSNALNIRVGGELAVDMFRFRAGFGLLPAPVDDQSEDIYNYSVGAGLRQESFYVDIAFRRTEAAESYVPYLTNLSQDQIVENEINTNRILLTLGFRF